MCIWVASNNKENLFQFYLLLKLIYTKGNTKLCLIERQALVKILGYSDCRPFNINLKRLIDLGWIRLNTRNKYYYLKSIDSIRKEYNWDSRTSIAIKWKDLNRVDAVIGSAIYTYLHKAFWRKVKKEKRVYLKGKTYHFLFPSFNYKTESAPVATTGIQELFNISKTKASRLKHKAEQHNLVSVTKSYSDRLFTEEEIKHYKKDDDQDSNFIKMKDGYRLQQIDQVLPKIPLTKRHKLGT